MISDSTPHLWPIGGHTSTAPHLCMSSLLIALLFHSSSVNGVLFPYSDKWKTFQSYPVNVTVDVPLGPLHRVQILRESVCDPQETYLLFPKMIGQLASSILCLLNEICN